MRGLHLRMATERFDPVVEVIDSDEEDIGSYGFCSGFRARCKGYRNERRKEKEGPGIKETLLHGCQDSTANVRGRSRAKNTMGLGRGWLRKINRSCCSEGLGFLQGPVPAWKTPWNH